MDSVKTCPKCKISKPYSEYNRGRNRSDGLQTYCRSCEKLRHKNLPDDQRSRKAEKARVAYQQEIATEEGLRQRQERAWKNWLWHKARLTPKKYHHILARQNGVCANPGCKISDPGRGKGWCIDHDHSCCPGRQSCGSCVRGLLCQNCNLLLGYASDKVTVLEGAIEYLKANGELWQP